MEWIPALTGASKGQRISPVVEYLEDPQSSLSVQEAAAASDEQWNAKGNEHRGSSRSTWWIRISTADLARGEYLSIMTPSLERVTLYLPSGSKGEYAVMKSGWGVPLEDHQDQQFAYPVFRLNASTSGDYAYLQLFSTYTQNYNVRILSEDSFLQTRQNHTGLILFFIGCILALGMNNIIQFATLRMKAHLYYVIYLISVTLYVSAILGYFNYNLNGIMLFMTELIAVLGQWMIIGVMLFSRSVLDMAKHFPIRNKLLSGCIGLMALLTVLFFLGYRFESNLGTIVLANIATLLVLHMTWQAIRRGFAHAKYLFAGWSLILLVSLIFNARAMGFIPNNELTTSIILLPTVIEAVLLSLSLSDLVEEIRSERERAMQLYQLAEWQALSRESAFLQAQIKPHFLYNTLNVIEALCYIDGRKAGELIQEFSKFLRHSFDFKNLDTYIPFSEELEFIQAYVKLEQTRFRNKLAVIYDLDLAELAGLRLPPLLLQPLVENAILHGIRKSEGAGTVTISVHREADHYDIAVADDGIGMTAEQIIQAMGVDLDGFDAGGAAGKQHSSVGLANIRKRLRMFYQTDLVIKSAPGEGTRVSIRLPNLREEGQES